MKISAYYQFVITDTKTGKILRKGRKRKCKSFVIGFLQALEYLMSAPFGGTGAAVQVKAVGGTSRGLQAQNSTSYPTGYAFNVASASGIATYGVVIGIGTNSVTTTDYTLQTLIAHGAGAGQLNYGATTMSGAVATSTNCELQFTRTFGNSSGDTITIRELGLIYASRYAAASSDYFLAIRDLVNVEVQDGETATAVLTLSTEL